MSALKICPQCGTEYELDQRFCPKDGSTLRMQSGGNDLVGQIIADRYHVLKKLGEGGMGQVYLAEHVKMGRRSAVKVMNPGMVNDADAISRFNREAANASRINHPNVAAVYDFGETSDGIIYLAMEFVEGPPLTKLIEQQGALTPLRGADITRQAADALTVAHDMGIVHRDLKPDNIMIAKTRDGGDLVKVVDFGIAKAADNAAQKVTKTGLVVGTPEYMSPEQLAGDKLDGRSDIYSLALVAFNMLTGKLPFPAETVQESMIMRLTDRPKRLADMRPEVPWSAEVQGVLDRALERDANLRYQTASEFGRDLLKTIEKMPMSVASQEGTMVMSAPGAPAVRSSPAGAPTAAMPATRVASSADLAALVSAPKQRNTLAIGAGVAAVVVLGAVGTLFALKGGSKTGQPLSQASTQTGAPGGNPTLAVGDTHRISQSGQNASATTTKTGSVALSRPLTNVPAARTGGAAESAPPAVKVDSVLQYWDDVLSNEATMTRPNAAQALKDLDGLGNKLTDPAQKVQAALVRTSAATIRDDSVGACNSLRSVANIATQTRFSRRVLTFMQATGCQ